MSLEGERGINNRYPALRLSLGLRNKMRFIAVLILRPFTSRNMRSIGVSRWGLWSMQRPPRRDVAAKIQLTLTWLARACTYAR
jgi:hypothetical protein